MNSNKIIKWLKIIILVFAFIFLLIGFLGGYFYSSLVNKSCVSNPLIYGVESLNKVNNVSFSCECVPDNYDLKPFYFDSDGVYITKDIKIPSAARVP